MTSRESNERLFENFVRDLDRECVEREAERWRRQREKRKPRKRKEMPIDIRHDS